MLEPAEGGPSDSDVGRKTLESLVVDVGYYAASRENKFRNEYTGKSASTASNRQMAVVIGGGILNDVQLKPEVSWKQSTKSLGVH